jgi:hypothetical protein
MVFLFLLNPEPVLLATPTRLESSSFSDARTAQSAAAVPFSSQESSASVKCRACASTHMGLRSKSS